MISVDENSVIEPLDNSVVIGGLRLLEEREMNVFWQLTRHGRKFFVKGINQGYADRAKALSLLRKEYDLGMRLDHRGIVRFVSMEDVPGAGECIIMEWIDGVTLREWMRMKPSCSKRIRMAGEILGAVSYMARMGVAHRDLKPDNIMVRGDGDLPCLIDFGHGDSEDFVTHKFAAGTASFGSPEQHRHTSSGCEADVYALGKLLEFLRMPMVYKSLILSCLREAPSSRPKASVVRKRFMRYSLLKRYLIVAVVVVGLVIVAWVLRGGTAEKHEQPQRSEVQAPTTVAGADDEAGDVELPVEDMQLAPKRGADAVQIPEVQSTVPVQPESSDWESVTGQKVAIPSGYTADKAYDKAVKEVDALFKAYEERFAALRITDYSQPKRDNYYEDLQATTGEFGEAYGKIMVRLSAELNKLGLAHEEIIGYLTRLNNYYTAEFKSALGH